MIFDTLDSKIVEWKTWKVDIAPTFIILQNAQNVN